jgi:hypothetical protein
VTVAQFKIGKGNGTTGEHGRLALMDEKAGRKPLTKEASLA